MNNDDYTIMCIDRGTDYIAKLKELGVDNKEYIVGSLMEELDDSRESAMMGATIVGATTMVALLCKTTIDAVRDTNDLSPKKLVKNAALMFASVAIGYGVMECILLVPDIKRNLRSVFPKKTTTTQINNTLEV